MCKIFFRCNSFNKQNIIKLKSETLGYDYLDLNIHCLNYSHFNNDYNYDCFIKMLKNERVLLWNRKNIKSKMYFTGICSIIQNTCARFLKYLIKTYINKNNYDIKEYTFIMRSHSLRNICNFISNELKDINLNKAKICQVDGYYFSSRYPGKDAFIVEKSDILLCCEALLEFKKDVYEYI